MTIADIAAHLIAEAGLGTQGRDLFVYHAPENIKRSILVLEDLDGIPIDEELPGYHRANFQVIIRNPDYQSAMTIAKQVMNALNLSRQTVNGVEIKRMRATHLPIPFPIPDSDVIEVSVNLWAAFVEP